MAVKQKEIDHGWIKIIENHKGLTGIDLQVGSFSEVESDDPEINLAARALVNEFGDKNKRIPKRPFTANAFDYHLEEIKDFIAQLYKNVIDAKENLRQMINKVGVKHEGQIKRSITEFTYTPNSPETIRKKRSSTPLIDTGIMRNSVKYKVVIKK